MNFENVEPKENGKIYYTVKVKETTITVTTTSIELMFALDQDSSKYPLFLSLIDVRKLCLQKYAHLARYKRPINPVLYLIEMRVYKHKRGVNCVVKFSQVLFG